MATQGSHQWVSDPGPLSWHDQAACAGLDTSIFFPIGTPSRKERGEQPNEYDEAAMVAKRICAWCPVKDECRDWAIRELGVGTANDDLGSMAD